MSVTINVETPLQDEVRALVSELNAVLLELTPPEHCHHLTVEQMADAATTVFIARDNGVAFACGALKRHADGISEVEVAPAKSSVPVASVIRIPISNVSLGEPGT